MSEEPHISLSRRWTPTEDIHVSISTATSEHELVRVYSLHGNVAYTNIVGLIEATNPLQTPQPAKYIFSRRQALSGARQEIQRFQTPEEQVGTPGATVASLIEWPDLWDHPEKARAAKNIAELISYLEHAELQDWNSVAEALNFALYLHTTPLKRFDTLVTSWKADVKFSSDTNEICTHAAYQQIIGMGCLALPFIFAAMEKEADHWFWALKAITGHDPVPEAHRGDLDRMTEAWLTWAKHHRKRLTLKWATVFASEYVYE